MIASIEVQTARGAVLERYDGNLEILPRLGEYVVIDDGERRVTYVVRGLSHVIRNADEVITGHGVIVTVGLK